MNITRYAALPDDLIEPFWELYASAFEPLLTRSPAREVLTRAEFDEEMADARVMKYLARDEDGTAVGLMTLTRDLSSVPWISPQYYAARYPEHAARDAIFYLGFTLVRPVRQRQNIFATMLAEGIREVLSVDGICGYDMCAYNLDKHSFDKVLDRVCAAMGSSSAVAVIDTQTYFMAGPRLGEL
jgi:hypothetical protein